MADIKYRTEWKPVCSTDQDCDQSYGDKNCLKRFDVENSSQNFWMSGEACTFFVTAETFCYEETRTKISREPYASLYERIYEDQQWTRIYSDSHIEENEFGYTYTQYCPGYEHQNELNNKDEETFAKLEESQTNSDITTAHV